MYIQLLQISDVKTIGEKGKPFLELSQLYTLRAKKNNPYIAEFPGSAGPQANGPGVSY
jgi:hypothetical protein